MTGRFQSLANAEVILCPYESYEAATPNRSIADDATSYENRLTARLAFSQLVNGIG